MKVLGLIGGVSPESTAIYYRLLNEAVRRHMGGEHSAKLMIYSMDYGVMIGHYNDRNWDAFTEEVVNAGSRLHLAGAEGLIICSNTTHVAAESVSRQTGLPVIHLLDALTSEMVRRNVRRPLLLGTPVVMSEGYYRTALDARYDGETLIPSAAERGGIGDIILNELVNGIVRDQSREVLLEMIRRHPCDGIILGCTELCMILNQNHCDLPVFDTTAIHAAAAASFAFGESGD